MFLASFSANPTTLAFIPNIGTGELIVIAIVALLFFGKRLPEVGRTLGKGIVEFKKGLNGIEDEIQNTDESQDQPQIAKKEENKAEFKVSEKETAEG